MECQNYSSGTHNNCQTIIPEKNTPSDILLPYMVFITMCFLS